MTKLIVSDDLRTMLSRLAAPVELCDEAGQTLGYFHPATATNAEGTEYISPFTREELQRRRQERSGRPLAEILDRLNRS